jgi:hypothetical protein
MKKMTLLFFIFTSFNMTSSFAEGNLNQIINSTEKNQTSVEKKKKRRRKKALMCNDCGKPETECECEGHGDHGKQAHSHDESSHKH